MKRRSLIAGLAASLAVVAVLAFGSLGASASVGHATYSNNWQGDFFISGLDTCPVLGGPSYSNYADGGVNVTDHIKSTYIPYNEPLFRIHSVGTVEGQIYAPDGTYTVTSKRLIENRIGDLGILFFRGSGPVTITGPGGTVTGKATFTDITSDFPQEEFFVFTSITRCNLN